MQLFTIKGISMRYYKNLTESPNNFEGNVTMLRCVFCSQNKRNVSEIHLDSDKICKYIHNTNVPYDKCCLLAVLIHEIGHALGISYSAGNTSINVWLLQFEATKHHSFQL